MMNLHLQKKPCYLQWILPGQAQDIELTALAVNNGPYDNLSAAEQLRFSDTSVVAVKLDEFYEDLIEEVKETLKEIPNKTEALAIKGRTAETLMEYAEDNGYDLIIIGSAGKSGVREYLGSVSHKVIHKSKIPVLVIK